MKIVKSCHCRLDLINLTKTYSKSVPLKNQPAICILHLSVQADLCLYELKPIYITQNII